VADHREPASDDPAWPLIQAWSAEATTPHVLLPAEEATGIATLDSLPGITEWSALGALARHCAALVVDDWLVVLGAGGMGYPGLREINASGSTALDRALVVGVDVMGGGFAINGGGLGCGQPGEVCYLGPDTLEWMECGFGHAEFVHWALNGPIDQFYEDLRWPDWRKDVARLAAGQGLLAYPPPWTVEGRGPNVSRKPVPLLEAWGVVLSFAQQLDRAGGDAD
jgi:hypothetical protein